MGLGNTRLVARCYLEPGINKSCSENLMIFGLHLQYTLDERRQQYRKQHLQQPLRL